MGSLDRDTVGRVVLDFLRMSSPHEAFMAEVWRAANTIRVVRAEPHTTSASKVLPLHVVRPGADGPARRA